MEISLIVHFKIFFFLQISTSDRIFEILNMQASTKFENEVPAWYLFHISREYFLNKHHCLILDAHLETRIMFLLSKNVQKKSNLVSYYINYGINLYYHLIPSNLWPIFTELKQSNADLDYFDYNL